MSTCNTVYIEDVSEELVRQLDNTSPTDIVNSRTLTTLFKLRTLLPTPSKNSFCYDAIGNLVDYFTDSLENEADISSDKYVDTLDTLYKLQQISNTYTQ